MIRKAGISAKAETPADSAIEDGSAPSCWRRTERNVKPARMPTWMSPMASSARGNRGARARATPTEPNRAVEIGLASVLGSSGVERGRRVSVGRVGPARGRRHRSQVGALHVGHEDRAADDDEGGQPEQDGHRRVAGLVVDEAGHDGCHREREARHQADACVVPSGIRDAVDRQRVGQRRKGRLEGREDDEADGDHERRHRQQRHRQRQATTDGRDLQRARAPQEHVGHVAPDGHGGGEGDGRRAVTTPTPTTSKPRPSRMTAMNG